MEMYFDSNVFIYYCSYPQSCREYKTAKIYIDRMEKSIFVGVTGYFTWDEVVWKIHTNTDNPRSLRDSIKLADCFLNVPNLVYLALDLSIIQKAKYIINKYNKDPRDALHSALAIIHSRGNIISNDHDFDSIHEVSRKFYLD